MEYIQQYLQSKIQPAQLSRVHTSGQMWLRCQDGWTCGGLSFLLRALHSEMHSKNRPIAQSKYGRLNFESPNKNQSRTKPTVSILEFNSIVLRVSVYLRMDFDTILSCCLSSLESLRLSLSEQGRSSFVNHQEAGHFFHRRVMLLLAVDSRIWWHVDVRA